MSTKNVYAQQAEAMFQQSEATCPVCDRTHVIFPAQTMPQGDDEAVMDACTGLLWAGDVAVILEVNAKCVS